MLCSKLVFMSGSEIICPMDSCCDSQLRPDLPSACILTCLHEIERKSIVNITFVLLCQCHLLPCLHQMMQTALTLQVLQRHPGPPRICMCF